MTTNMNWKCCLALLFAGTLALTGCSESTTGGEEPDDHTYPPGVTKGLNVEVLSVSGDSGIRVRFKLTDDLGFPVDVAGVYSVNAPIRLRFSLSYLSEDAEGRQLPLTVLTKAKRNATSALSPTAYNPLATTPQGTLIENGTGDGDYTYTFPSSDIDPTGATTKAVAYESSRRSNTHVVWIEATRQTDLDDPTNPFTFTAKNEAYYYVPAGGAPVTREIAATSNCFKCHDDFMAFHDGARIEAPYCEVCHNPARTSNPAADSMVFVHRIHASEELQRVISGTREVGIQLGGNPDGTDKDCTEEACACTAAAPCVPNAFHGIAEVTYPQSLRNCNGCHGDSAQGDQWKTRPTRAACGSCHDTIVWDNGSHHAGGAQLDDLGCNAAGCHTPDEIAAKHLPIVEPDLGSYFHVTVTTGTATSGSQANPPKTCTAASPCTCTVATPCLSAGNIRTNAAYLAAANTVPEGAAVISYDIKSVARSDTGEPVMEFKFKKTLNGTTEDVVFTPCTTTSTPAQELMDGFVGGPSVYFVYAMPQDGVDEPADFNVSTSAVVRNLCNGSATGNAAGTMIGPDAEGYYKVTLTAAAVAIPATAVMLTGGLGYSYDLSATSQPLTQTDLEDYPFDPATKAGGLIVPAPNVWKVASGYTGRRVIVENARCNACHVAMGVSPSYHVGQRNDGPTCAWCHTPNRASGGWSANSKDIMHAIHAGHLRDVPYTWHAVSATQNYSHITFPSRLNNCESCHLPGTYDFTAAASAAALPNLLWSTEATYAATDPAAYIRSPFVVGPFSALGRGYATSGPSSSEPRTCSPAVPCQAEGTSLVSSPITAACIACHDNPEVRDHMMATGGSFYAQRSTALSKREQCLLCHGNGSYADISRAHMGK